MSLEQLHQFVTDGDLVMVRTLIAANPTKVDEKTSLGYSALHFASYIGHVAIMNILTAAGAQVNEKNEHNLTALHMAALRGIATLYLHSEL